MSVPGIYDLPVMLEPDSSRPIPIGALNKTSGDKAQVGETVTVRAGPILDRNGHPVPDGTRVNLQFFYRAAAVYLPNQEIGTRNGVAETTVFLERPGQLEISAAAGRTSTTTPFVLAVQGEGPVTAVPTPQPSATPQPTLTVTPSPTVTATPAVAAQAATPLATGGGWAGLADGFAQAADCAAWEREGWGWFDCARHAQVIDQDESATEPQWATVRIDYTRSAGTSGFYTAEVRITHTLTTRHTTGDDGEYAYPRYAVRVQ